MRFVQTTAHAFQRRCTVRNLCTEEEKHNVSEWLTQDLLARSGEPTPHECHRGQRGGAWAPALLGGGLFPTSGAGDSAGPGPPVVRGGCSPGYGCPEQ